jgi:hypothetical protein
MYHTMERGKYLKGKDYLRELITDWRMLLKWILGE